MTKIYKTAGTLLLVLISLHQSQAQIIFKEPFDYPIGNLQGNGGGTGFPGGSIWSQTTTAASPGAVSNAQIISGNIVTGYGNTGNSVRVCTEATKTSFFDRAIALTLNDDNVTDYYLGFWYRGPGTLTSAQAAIPAQLIFMNAPNTTTANDMRLGFGKSSNVGLTTVLTGFTRASGETCGAATSWPSQTGNNATTYGTTALALPDGNGTYYILAKITKKEFTINAGTPATAQYFDGIRVWFLAAPPTGTSDPIFTARPNGDILTTVAGAGTPAMAPLSATDYANGIPIQSRALRPAGTSAGAPLYSSQTCASSTGGATGIRLRIEGATGFCFDFDEIRFGIGLDNIIILPITLEGISANQMGKSNIVNWTTASESNNKGFSVEQSDNGTTWKSIGFVQGANTGSQRVEYNFTDNNPYGITFYRLRQEDVNGKITFSKIVKVKRSNNVSIDVSPNPAQENINITLNKISNKNNVGIVDMQGRKILSTKFNGYRTSINIAALSKGIYFINITTENGTSVEKFVKN
jgi:Secretion system C-terminal sorting domain